MTDAILITLSWPVVGVAMVWWRFQPVTYLGLAACLVWGIGLGWLTIPIELLARLIDAKFWGKRFR